MESLFDFPLWYFPIRIIISYNYWSKFTAEQRRNLKMNFTYQRTVKQETGYFEKSTKTLRIINIIHI